MIKDRPFAFACLAVFLIITACVCWGDDHLIRELKPSPIEQEAEPGEEVFVLGRVYKTEDRQTSQILYIKNSSIYFHQRSLKESRILIYDKSKQPVNIGNKIYARGEVSFFDPPRNPGNFDQKFYYQKQDIHARVWAGEVVVKDRCVYRLRNGLNKFRRRWKQVLLDVMGEQNGNALSAMMLGDKTDMDRDLKELYQVNGIGHILAISGLHLSFIGLGIYRLIRRATGSFPIAGIFGIAFLLCYIVMSGFTVSAVRALVMFLFRVGADITGRNYDAFTALAAAGSIVVIWRPLSVYDGGFWLSFGAVLGILVILPAFEGFPFNGIWAGFSIHLSILPVLLYYFYEFPLYSIVLNLFVIPVMSLLLTLGMSGSILFLLLPGAGRCLLIVSGILLKFYEKICNVTLTLPASRVVTGRPQLWQIAVYYILLMACVLIWRCDRKVRRQKKQTHKIYHNPCSFKAALSIVFLFLGTAVLTVPGKWSQSRIVEITVLDVGQGDGIFIRGTDGTVCLIDGGSSDVKDVGRYRIEPFLKYMGSGHIDYAFITHGDSDHINGIEEMIKRKKTGLPIKNLVLPPEPLWDESLIRLSREAALLGIRVLVMEKGDTLKIGEMVFSCLHPEEGYGEGPGNSASLTLSFVYREFSMLFTGDIEGSGEKELTDCLKGQASFNTYDILKTAHHGSKNSSSKEFLEAVHPRYAVVSAGRDNRYGHPHKETMERLRDSGCRIFSTQDKGAVDIKVKGTHFFVCFPCI